jgi:hypothetical protein
MAKRKIRKGGIDIYTAREYYVENGFEAKVWQGIERFPHHFVSRAKGDGLSAHNLFKLKFGVSWVDVPDNKPCTVIFTSPASKEIRILKKIKMISTLPALKGITSVLVNSFRVPTLETIEFIYNEERVGWEVILRGGMRKHAMEPKTIKKVDFLEPLRLQSTTGVFPLIIGMAAGGLPHANRLIRDLKRRKQDKITYFLICFTGFTPSRDALQIANSGEFEHKEIF